MTLAMWFALAGLVCLVCALVMAEMFERAIEEHIESHDSFYGRGEEPQKDVR